MGPCAISKGEHNPKFEAQVKRVSFAAAGGPHGWSNDQSSLGCSTNYELWELRLCKISQTTGREMYLLCMENFDFVNCWMGENFPRIFSWANSLIPSCLSILTFLSFLKLFAFIFFYFFSLETLVSNIYVISCLTRYFHASYQVWSYMLLYAFLTSFLLLWIANLWCFAIFCWLSCHLCQLVAAMEIEPFDPLCVTCGCYLS